MEYGILELVLNQMIQRPFLLDDVLPNICYLNNAYDRLNETMPRLHVNDCENVHNIKAENIVLGQLRISTEIIMVFLSFIII